MSVQSLNMNFDERLVIHTAEEQNWSENPPDPLRRMRLESNTAKKADGTSIVYYPAGSSVSGHAHPGGEEILVLKGTFQDENGSYPEGTHLRNPIGYYHDPY